MIITRYYEQLGQLIYAVLAVDGRLTTSEIERMNEVLSDLSKKFETQADMGGVLIAKIAFKNAIDRRDKPSRLLADFDRFILHATRLHLPAPVRQLSVDLLTYAAVIVDGIRLPEQKMLDGLRQRINALE